MNEHDTDQEWMFPDLPTEPVTPWQGSDSPFLGGHQEVEHGGGIELEDDQYIIDPDKVPNAVEKWDSLIRSKLY